MPIEGINTVLFDKFTAFASERVAARSGKSIARLTEGGAMHTITAADPRNDSIGKWRRRNDECTLNDQIRTLFRQAVADLFGGEARIPESVKKAMLLKDYGHGKPLSAHRIDVVRQAVERHFDAFPAAFAEAKTKAPNAYNHFNVEDVEASMAQALSTVSADPDATRLVVKLMDNLLVTANVQLRTPAAIHAKAKALLANVQELRAAAKGNRRVFETGLELLGQLMGKALPAGAFRNVIGAVKPPSCVRPGCGITKLHKAFASYAKAVDTLLVDSGVTAVLQDAPDRIRFNLFVGHLMMAKCNRQNLQGLHDALHGEDGKKLQRFYWDLAQDAFEYDVPDQVYEGMKNLAMQYGQGKLNQFDGLLAKALGFDEDSYEGLPPVSNGDFEYSRHSISAIGQDLKRTVQGNINAYVQQGGN